MALTPFRLLVAARDGSPRVLGVRDSIERFLSSQTGVEVRYVELSDDLNFSEGNPELIIVLGGDGAILRACRQMGRVQRPILGLNLGRLGFLADLSPDEFLEQFPRLRAREFHVSEHLMFECTITRDDGSCEVHLGLNEVALTSAVCLRMIDVELQIEDQPVTTYSCDGLIVSTPVGSTAHSLSAGGPILNQDLHAFVVTPICPHTLTNRPVIDHADRRYSLRVARAAEGAVAVIDGQIRRPIGLGDRIEIRRAPCAFRLARLPGARYYATLHKKLGWGGQPRYQG